MSFRIIWTMWDIKEGNNEPYYIEYEYYLNYVGYKVRQVLQGLPPSYSIIWTMWDIKVRERAHDEDITTYYLNYVGYKVKGSKSAICHPL